MELVEFYENLNNKKLPILQLLFFLVCVVLINYIGIYKNFAPSLSYLVIVFFASLLFLLNPLYSFLLLYMVYIDIMGCFGTTGAKLLVISCMLFVFLIDAKSFKILNDKKLKIIVSLAIFFGLYVLLFNIGLKSGLTSLNLTQNFGYMFGFITIIPAYYFTIKQPKTFFISIVIVAGAFVATYFFSLIKGLDLFKLSGGDRGTGANIERLAGYDVRQFAIFFFYLIPASALADKLKIFYKIVLISIGIGCFIVLVLAFYRLAMFYVSMGTLLSFLFIRKYAPSVNLLKIFFYIIIFFISVNFLFGDYIKEVNNLFSATIDYFLGKGTDTSADERAGYQMPIVIKLFYDNWWTGFGLIEMREYMKLGMMGFVDMPFIGTLATFGFGGMCLYYLKYFFLLAKSKIEYSSIANYLNTKPVFVYYFYLTLKAYLISMITFRLFYISWELTFESMQGEFGMFAGVFLALNHVFKNYDEEHL